jgi:anti-sigma factor RsiW
MSDHDTPRPQPHDPDQLGRYLLGRLSQEESDALESHLLHDSRLFELAEATEDELIDRYVRDELPAEDAKRFERHLLPSRRIRERVDVARALAAWADGERSHQPATARPDSGDVVVPISRQHRRFQRTARLAWAAALVAAIAAGALSFEVIRLHERLDDAGTVAGVEQAQGVVEAPEPVVPDSATEPAEGESQTVPSERVESLERELTNARNRIASLESEVDRGAGGPVAGSSLTEDLAIATFFIGAATRSASSKDVVVSLEDADRIKLQLYLGPTVPSGDLHVRVTQGDTLIWEESDLEVETVAGESAALLILNRESLEEGSYLAVLTEEGHEDEPRSYPFSVER